jgi:long-chain acyl-CoA synthetase
MKPQSDPIAQSFSSPISAFYHWEKYAPDRVFLQQPVSGKWHTYTYRQAGAEIRKVAAAISGLSLPARSNICILSKNCAHWVMADLAIWMAGHISVPIYPTLSSSGIQFIIEHCGASAIFVGKLDNYDEQRVGIPEVIPRICFSLYGTHDGTSWESIVGSPDAITDSPKPNPDATASIMYSSGTTGNPKGVVLSFAAFDFVGRSMIKGIGLTPADQFFSYLPMSHIAEKAYVEMGLLYSGGSVAFTESLDKFPHNLQEIQPTLFGGVPRIFAKFREGVLSRMPQSRLNILLRIPLVKEIVKKAIRKKLGLARARFILGGAAPIPTSLLEWFRSLDIVIQEIYGMTEDCGFSHGDHALGIRIGTVGRAWPDVLCSISEEGEILVRHPGLMTGYYKDEVTTEAVFTSNGFLKTGDEGFEDKDGYLTITGRKNDQFKTEKGKFIAPAPIETKLHALDEVDQALVVGSGLPQPIVLVVLKATARSRPRDVVSSAILSGVARINENIEKYEVIRKVVVLRDEWTIENGLLTPSMKVRRSQVEKIHRGRYVDWYAHKDEIIWE